MGGSLKLTDADLMKTPLIVMMGHDPAMLRAYNLMGPQYGGGKLDNKLSETDIIALRKYLVEKGGFLFFNDCGVNASAQAMARLFLAQMRRVMPEYQIERISNNHEVYHNFYALGGPPWDSTSIGGEHARRINLIWKAYPLATGCPF